MQISNYPDFNRLADRGVAQQFKLVWDILKKLATEVSAITVPDITALQTALRTLQQTVAKDERQAAGLSAAIDGKLSRAYALLYAVAGNVGVAETDLTNSGYSVTIPPILAAGAGFRITMAGALKANTATKVLKLYFNGGATTLLSDAANVASNRWFASLEIIRATGTAGRLSGLLSHGATFGAAPTVLHWGALALTGLNWEQVAGQVLRLAVQGSVGVDDIQIVHWTVEPLL